MREVLVATHKDIEGIVEIGHLAWAEHHWAEVGEYSEENTRTMLHQMVDGDYTMVVIAREGDNIVGYIALVVAPIVWGNVVAAVETLWWVHPDHRQQGVGNELLDAGAEWAEIMGCQLVEAHNHEGKRIVRWVTPLAQSSELAQVS